MLLRTNLEAERAGAAEFPHEAESSSLSGVRQGFSWGEAVAGSLYPDGRILSWLAVCNPVRK